MAKVFKNVFYFQNILTVKFMMILADRQYLNISPI